MARWRLLRWVLAASLPAGLVAVACGGKVARDPDCRRFGADWQFCPAAVVCCPGYSVCGTGEPNDAGYTCALGDCCLPFDVMLGGGSGAPGGSAPPLM